MPQRAGAGRAGPENTEVHTLNISAVVLKKGQGQTWGQSHVFPGQQAAGYYLGVECFT